MIKTLFILAVVFLPFSDFAGLGSLGEIGHDLSGHIMLLALGLTAIIAARSYVVSQGRGYAFADPGGDLLLKIFYLFIAVIALSLVFNLDAIMTTAARSRNGLGKFIASSVMIIVGFGWAYVSMIVGRRHSWSQIMINPMAIGIVICAVFAILEGLSFHFGGAFEALQLATSEFTHSGSRGQKGMGGFEGGAFGWYDDTPGKTRSVAFEAPALADYVGMALPWLYAGFSESRGNRKLRYLILILIALGLMYASAARTAYVFLACNFAVIFLLKYVYLPERGAGFFRLRNAVTLCLWVLAALGIAAYVYTYNDLTQVVSSADPMDGRNISNISRLAMVTSGWNMMLNNPFFGLGFGQYGFKVIEHLPDWAWQSWEIKAWFTGQAKIWPSAFNCFVRFGAELGLTGLLLWTGLWIYLARRVYAVTLQYRLLTGETIIRAYPLIMGCYAVLAHGVASDALRSPIIWMTLGLCCLYIGTMRKLINDALPPFSAAQQSAAKPAPEEKPKKKT